MSGTSLRGQFEERISQIVREASQAKDVILFIDEIHTIVGAGSGGGALDAAQIMKPALGRVRFTVAAPAQPAPRDLPGNVTVLGGARGSAGVQGASSSAAVITFSQE